MTNIHLRQSAAPRTPPLIFTGPCNTGNQNMILHNLTNIMPLITWGLLVSGPIPRRAHIIKTMTSTHLKKKKKKKNRTGRPLLILTNDLCFQLKKKKYNGFLNINLYCDDKLYVLAYAQSSINEIANISIKSSHYSPEINGINFKTKNYMWACNDV